MNSPLSILQQYWQHAAFKPQQEAIIHSILDQHDTFVLLPTGGGKSVCYQIPALLLDGICIVISPLIALIQDQVTDLKKKGIKAQAIVGSLTTEELVTIFDNCRYGNYKFLYVSPERLQNELVLEHLKTLYCSFIAVDEAHCISQWGNDFRPAYKNINSIRLLFPDVPMVALTATATPTVQEDIIASLELRDPKVFQSSFKRDNIAFLIINTESKFAQLVTLLERENNAAIVYVNTRKTTLQLARYLNDNYIHALPFHGGLTLDEKKKHLNAWLENRCNVIVATSAFGMGIDKPNVGTVIHFNLPDSLENYYQEAGRAGRNGHDAKAIILKNNRDVEEMMQHYLSILPTNEDIRTLYKHLNNYFQISYGEGQDQSFNFSFSNFCNRYQLAFQKTFHALNFLERQGVIRLTKNYKHQTEITFTVPNATLLNYLERNPDLSLITKSILRSYGGVMDHEIQINVYWLAKKLGLPAAKFFEVLKTLQQDEMATVHFYETDASITFLVPREDHYTINKTLSYLKQQNQNKKRLLQQMMEDVAFNGCNQRYILNYFGDKLAKPCGICSNCMQQKQVSYLKWSKTILSLIEHKNIELATLPAVLSLSNEQTSKLVKRMINEKLITLNQKNEITIAHAKS